MVIRGNKGGWGQPDIMSLIQGMFGKGGGKCGWGKGKAVSEMRVLRNDCLSILFQLAFALSRSF